MHEHKRGDDDDDDDDNKLDKNMQAGNKYE